MNEYVFPPKNETVTEEDYEEISIKEEPINEREESSIYVEDVNLFSSVNHYSGETMKNELCHYTSDRKDNFDIHRRKQW